VIPRPGHHPPITENHGAHRGIQARDTGCRDRAEPDPGQDQITDPDILDGAVAAAGPHRGAGREAVMAS
jgi:hypothetical protein